MKAYIGCKMVKAERMSRGEYNLKRGWQLPADENPDDAGYALVYPDGYVSWSPKEIFESAYMQLEDNKSLPSGVSIGQEMVDGFVAMYETTTMGECTTVVRCALKNGFTIVESSSCVDPKNYSEKIGKEICIRKIKDKIWELLGFLLQTAVNGVNN